LRIARETRECEINIDDIPSNDEQTFQLLQKAETTGVFQLESSGMKRYLKLLKPTTFEDVIAMVALYRPGPMDWIPDFIARKHGQKEIKYLHPKLKSILEKTYGVAVYQEQIMQIARDLAGFSLGEADVLRKAVGKKISALIQEQKQKFIDGCVRQGINAKIAEKVFAFIEPFAGYGFNRSHAACYAMIGYQTAYLKAHFPAEFMAALLTSDQDNIDRVAIEVSECRDMDIEVLPPHINESFEEFAVIIDPKTKKERIRFGLNAIKNVGHTVAHEIVEERKRNGNFKNITDFVERVESKDLNKKSIEALAKVGGLEGMGERNQVVASIENILAHSKNHQNTKNSNQFSLFEASEISLPEINLLEVPVAEKKQRLSWEKELLGLYISDHPTREYRAYFKKVAVPIKEITLEMVERKINVGGIISSIHRVYLKNQKTMLFVTIEDTEGKMEVIVFPKILDDTSLIWQEDKIVMISGKVSNKDGDFKLICDSVKTVNPETLEDFETITATQKANGHKEKKTVAKVAGTQKIIITLPSKSSQEELTKLSKFFDHCDLGATKIYISVDGSRLETPYRINPSPGKIELLNKLIPNGKIEIF